MSHPLSFNRTITGLQNGNCSPNPITRLFMWSVMISALSVSGCVEPETLSGDPSSPIDNAPRPYDHGVGWYDQGVDTSTSADVSVVADLGNTPDPDAMPETHEEEQTGSNEVTDCLLYTSPSPRD